MNQTKLQQCIHNYADGLIARGNDLKKIVDGSCWGIKPQDLEAILYFAENTKGIINGLIAFIVNQKISMENFTDD